MNLRNSWVNFLELSRLKCPNFDKSDSGSDNFILSHYKIKTTLKDSTIQTKLSKKTIGEREVANRPPRSSSHATTPEVGI